MKVALVYDRVNKWGGAERVLLALSEIFPSAPLFTSVYSREKAVWAKRFQVKTSFLQKIPGAKNNHELLPLLMPIAFENFNFDEYDVVISVTSEAAKGIITKPQTLHICYCLTPTRYLWSGYQDYFKNPFLSFLTKPFVWYLRLWDKVASNRPDFYFAISQTIKERIEKYYNKKVEAVIYPPVAFNFPKVTSVKTESKEKYFLVVSRLVAYKRIDIVIEACNKLKIPLKIVGSGREEKKLKNLAGPTVEFYSDLTDWELSRYYQNCRALIFPGVEDFGIALAEAQLAGKPVLAYKKGGAGEIVIPGKTGELFKTQSVESLVKVLEKFEPMRYNREDCVSRGQKFSQEVFKRQIEKQVKLLWKKHQQIFTR